MVKEYHMDATWDPDAQVWTATSSDVPGLVVESDTLEELVKEAKAIVPDLLELNCGIKGPADISLVVLVPKSNPGTPPMAF
jgi:hypothetical protein